MVLSTDALTIASQNPQSVQALLQQADCLNRLSDSPRLDMELLLCAVLECSRARLLAFPEKLLSQSQQRVMTGYLHRRQQGEPVAYILGRKAFWDFELQVDRRVLIPRPETELLVERALHCLRGREQERLQLLDLGTGSGAIALALARYSRSWQLSATDRSAESLAVAAANASQLQLTDIDFIHCDWFDGLGGRRFDAIVSNPPYVAAEDPHLQQDGLPFEPRAALVAEDNGLSCLQAIIEQAGSYLDAGGWLLLEHGCDQAAAVRVTLQAAGFAAIRCWQDVNGLDRVTEARAGRPEENSA